MANTRSVAKRICFLRRHRGVSLTALGQKIGLRHPYTRMAQYESAERTPKEPMLVAIAQVLGVSPVALTSCVGTTAVDLMESIFWIENFEGVEVVRACIQEWVQMRAMYDSGLMDKEAYLEWKYQWSGLGQGETPRGDGRRETGDGGLADNDGIVAASNESCPHDSSFLGAHPQKYFRGNAPKTPDRRGGVT